jgi:pimeloyl-ACP methyl ester carboxylesterase
VTEPADGWLDRDGVSLHYLEWRPDVGVVTEPPILLLHGLSSNARYWERLARHLPGRRLVGLDQRGHGLTGRPPKSPALPGGYAMDELLNDASFTISELGLGRPVVVGHSWGATVALELVGTRSELTSGLVFIDGPVQGAANLFSWEDAQRFMQPPLPRFSSFEAAVAESKHDFDGAWGDDLESFVRARIVPEGSGWILTLTAPVRLELLRGLFDSQVDALWPRVGVPAVALLARRGPAMISAAREQGVTRLATAAPRVQVVWFNTPHDIPLFKPAEVALEVERISSRAADRDSSEAAAG